MSYVCQVVSGGLKGQLRQQCLACMQCSAYFKQLFNLTES